MPTVTTNGIVLHFLDHPGNEPAIVLMHGLTANAAFFEGLVAHGLSPRRRVIAPDLRGRGLSDKPETGYRMEDHAADILGLIDALGLDRPVLGGHSYGGLLAMYMGAHFPDRFRALVVIDAALTTAHPRTIELIRPSLARLGRTLPSWEAYKAAMQANPFLQGYWDEHLEHFYRADVQDNPDGSVQARAHADHIAQAMDGTLAVDWAAILAAITVPVLLLHADGAFGPPGTPPIVSRADAHDTAERLATCRYVDLPGNHYTMLLGIGARLAADEIAAWGRAD